MDCVCESHDMLAEQSHLIDIIIVIEAGATGIFRNLVGHSKKVNQYVLPNQRLVVVVSAPMVIMMPVETAAHFAPAVAPHVHFVSILDQARDLIAKDRLTRVAANENNPTVSS
jgi:hypothetical protein